MLEKLPPSAPKRSAKVDHTQVDDESDDASKQKQKLKKRRQRRQLQKRQQRRQLKQHHRQRRQLKFNQKNLT